MQKRKKHTRTIRLMLKNIQHHYEADEETLHINAESDVEMHQKVETAINNSEYGKTLSELDRHMLDLALHETIRTITDTIFVRKLLRD